MMVARDSLPSWVLHGKCGPVWRSRLGENGTVTHFLVMALSSCKNFHKLICILFFFFSQHNNFELLAKRKLLWGKFYFFILNHVSGSCFCYLDASVLFLGFKCPGFL